MDVLYVYRWKQDTQIPSRTTSKKWSGYKCLEISSGLETAEGLTCWKEKTVIKINHEEQNLFLHTRPRQSYSDTWECNYSRTQPHLYTNMTGTDLWQNMGVCLGGQTSCTSSHTFPPVLIDSCIKVRALSYSSFNKEIVCITAPETWWVITIKWICCCFVRASVYSSAKPQKLYFHCMVTL